MFQWKMTHSMIIRIFLHLFLNIQRNPYKTKTLFSNNYLSLPFNFLLFNLALILILFDFIKNDFNLYIDILFFSVEVNTKLFICKVT
jgi:hypothetical protein